MQHFLVYRRPPAINNNSGDGGNCQDGQRCGFQRQARSVQNSKCDTGISDIRYVKKAVYYGDCLIEQKPAMDEPFGPAVQAEDGENENRVRQPGLEFPYLVQGL